MIRQGLDRFAPGVDAGRCHGGSAGTGRDHLPVQRTTLMRDLDGPIQALFDHHMCRSDLIAHLIEAAMVRHGPVAA